MKIEVLFIFEILTLVVNTQTTGTCTAFICDSSYSSCTTLSGTNVYINQNACQSNKNLGSFLGDEECFISEDNSESFCLKKLDYTFPEFLYPGYSCSQGSSTSQCTFGPK